MNYTTILKKNESVLLWIYKRITNKFMSLYSKLKEWFPVLNKHPLLKHSLIPVLIALFFLLRYIIKFIINELAAWTSGFVGEISGYAISEGIIILGIAAVFVILRIGLKLKSQKNKNNMQLELNDESTK